MALTLQDVEGLSYRDLQVQCKARNLKATGKASELVERLKESIAAEAPPKAAPSKPTQTKPAPSRAAPAPKGHALADTPPASTPPKAATRARGGAPTRTTRLAVAQSSTHPTTALQWYHSPKRLLLANLLLVLVGGMLGAAVLLQQPQHAHLKASLIAHVDHAHTKAAAHVHAFTMHVQQHWTNVHTHIGPYTDGVTAQLAQGWQHVVSTVEPFTTQACTSLQHWWGVLVQQVELMYREVQYWLEHGVQWATLQWQRVIAYFTTGSVCSQQLGPHTLKGLVRDEPHWQAVLQGVQPGLVDADQPAKATAVVLATPASTAVAITKILHDRVMGRCGGECTKVLRGREWFAVSPAARGELQSELATFFKSCPGGAVVVSEVERLHPGLLPVFNNVLSEQGQLQLDGEPVPTSQGVFWFVATVPEAMYSKASHPDFAAAVKNRLAKQWSKYDDEQQVDREHPQTLTALALRRRFDHVLPAVPEVSLV